MGGTAFRSSTRSSYRPSPSVSRSYSRTTTVRRPVIINNYGGGYAVPHYGYGVPFGGFHFGFSPFGGFGGYSMGYGYGFGYNPSVTIGLSIADLLIRES